MNCLFDSFTLGCKRIPKREDRMTIKFFSQKEKRFIEGVILDQYGEYGAIVVQYELKGKREMAIVKKQISYGLDRKPKRVEKATIEELFYVSAIKNGIAIACQRGVKRLNVIILNERGQKIYVIGRRRTLMQEQRRKKNRR